jgi:hypothetical protein
MSEKQLAIDKHNQKVFKAFPDIEDEYANNLELILPSTMHRRSFTTSNLKAWAKLEIMLRVGHGHELLQEVREGASEHSFYTGKQKDSRGTAQMSKVKKSQYAAARKKSKSVSLYKKNWDKLDILFLITNTFSRLKHAMLKGLREINRDEDVVYFEEWGEKTHVFNPEGRIKLSWVWRVAMQENEPVLDGNQESFGRLTSAWEAEGRRIPFL